MLKSLKMGTAVPFPNSAAAQSTSDIMLAKCIAHILLLGKLWEGMGTNERLEEKK
jgi:hypothetical protein